jgi:hypothetical protein
MRDTMVRPGDVETPESEMLRQDDPETTCRECGGKKDPRALKCWTCWHRQAESLGMSCASEGCPEHGTTPKSEADPRGRQKSNRR